MSDGKKYYCFCGSNCKYETMTKEQILAAITQAVETGKIHDVDTGFVTKVKETNGGKAVTFWVGTQAQYNAIENKELNCMYIITDDTKFEDLEKSVAEKFESMATAQRKVYVNEATEVWWYSNGQAESWTNYDIPNVTTPHERGGLFLSSRVDLPLPDIYKNTRARDPYYTVDGKKFASVNCDVVLIGAIDPEITNPIMLFTAGSSDEYKSDARIYFGAINQITEGTRVRVRVHLRWAYKQEAEK